MIHPSNRRKESRAVEVGSGNVFADLGFADAVELDLKVGLAVEIMRLIEARRLSQAAAAALLKIGQLSVLELKNYKLDNFSAWELVSYVLCLGQDVEIHIRSRRPSNAARRILVEAKSM